MIVLPQSVRRLATGAGLLALVMLLGGFALYEIGGGRWGLGESIYMSIISAATVGFGELPDLEKISGARLVTVVIILLGIGAFTFFQSALTAFFVEGALGQAFRRKRMHDAIVALRGHVVVAGCGSTGIHTIEELAAAGLPFVVIDRDHGHLEHVSQHLMKGRMLYVHGNATEDAVLAEAGVERASGVVAALTHDRDNLYVTLSARTLNLKARIVTKVVELEAVPKMVRAGANATVSPNTIGGLRLAAELIRPTVVGFLDEMRRDKERNIRFEEVEIPKGSKFAGRKVRDVELREKTGTVLVAVKAPDQLIRFNPGEDELLVEGEVLVVLGDAVDVKRLRALVGA